MMGSLFTDDIMSSASSHYSEFPGGFQDPSPLSCLSLETLNCSNHQILGSLEAMTPITTALDTDIQQNNTAKRKPVHEKKRKTQYWTPVQRICQLNHALSFVENYNDHKYWDRIVDEFFNTNSILKIELVGLDKVFDLTPIIIPKFFWIWSLTGMCRLQVFPSKIKESFTINPNGEVFINFTSCPDSFMNCFHLNNQLVINHFGPHDISFTADSRIDKWTMRIEKNLEFSQLSSTLLYQDILSTDYSHGFHNNVLMFLDSSIVMASILPDHSSWFTWLITFIQQQNIPSSLQFSSFLQVEQVGVDVINVLEKDTEEGNKNDIKDMMDEMLEVEPELEVSMPSAIPVEVTESTTKIRRFEEDASNTHEHDLQKEMDNDEIEVDREWNRNNDSGEQTAKNETVLELELEIDNRRNDHEHGNKTEEVNHDNYIEEDSDDDFLNNYTD